CSAVAIASSRAEFDITTSHSGERRSSCERERESRERSRRRIYPQFAGKSVRTRLSECTRPALSAVVGYGSGSSPSKSSPCAAWRRRETYPRPPAARSRIDIPPRTSSGIGTDDGLEVSTSGATWPGSPPFPFEPPLLPPPLSPPFPPLAPPPGCREQSS